MNDDDAVIEQVNRELDRIVASSRRQRSEMLRLRSPIFRWSGPRTRHEAVARACMEYADELSGRDQDFLENVINRRTLSRKQTERLEAIAAWVCRDRAKDELQPAAPGSRRTARFRRRS